MMLIEYRFCIQPGASRQQVMATPAGRPVLAAATAMPVAVAVAAPPTAHPSPAVAITLGSVDAGGGGKGMTGGEGCWCRDFTSALASASRSASLRLAMPVCASFASSRKDLNCCRSCWLSSIALRPWRLVVVLVLGGGRWWPAVVGGVGRHSGGR